MLNLTSKNNLSYILLLLLILEVLALLYTGLIVEPAPDSNYYIPIARDILDGYVPTFDVKTQYTPFVYYILAGFFLLFGTSYEIAAITIFLFSLSNIFLIFSIFKYRLKFSLNWSLLFLCIYTFLLFRLTTFYFLLEPFQLFFALTSFILITAKNNNILRIICSGLLMGISIMCKQYSALFAIGIGIWMFYRLFIKEISFKEFLISIILWFSAILIPYFIFVLFTKASLLESLVAFGFIGDGATSYAKTQFSFINIGWYEKFKVIVLHLIEFMPFIVYPIYRMIDKNEKNTTFLKDGIFIVGLISIAVVYVRQYAHYFQLILPWSIMLWAIMLNDYWNKRDLIAKYILFRYFLIICFLVSLPAAFYMSPKIFIYHFKTNVILKKSYEIDFKTEALQIFKSGTSVYVRGNNVLYVSCNYRNPVHNYDFLSPVEMIREGKIPRAVNNVIIPKHPSDIYLSHKKFFLDNGFKVKSEKKFGLYLERITN